MAFTKDQMDMYRAYEVVRESGYYNMLDPKAREMSGLGRQDYLYVIKNYTAMKAQHDLEKQWNSALMSKESLVDAA